MLLSLLISVVGFGKLLFWTESSFPEGLIRIVSQVELSGWDLANEWTIIRLGR